MKSTSLPIKGHQGRRPSLPSIKTTPTHTHTKWEDALQISNNNLVNYLLTQSAITKLLCKAKGASKRQDRSVIQRKLHTVRQTSHFPFDCKNPLRFASLINWLCLWPWLLRKLRQLAPCNWLPIPAVRHWAHHIQGKKPTNAKPETPLQIKRSKISLHHQSQESTCFMGGLS